jgi:hypothetical protein
VRQRITFVANERERVVAAAHLLRFDADESVSELDAELVAGAVLPGVPLSVHAVMSQLEREPGETIVDAWLRERITFVAIERERVVAAAHLLRFDADESV